MERPNIDPEKVYFVDFRKEVKNSLNFSYNFGNVKSQDKRFFYRTHTSNENAAQKGLYVLNADQIEKIASLPYENGKQKKITALELGLGVDPVFSNKIEQISLEKAELLSENERLKAQLQELTSKTNN